jgi:hypothetical protein
MSCTALFEGFYIWLLSEALFMLNFNTQAYMSLEGFLKKVVLSVGLAPPPRWKLQRDIGGVRKKAESGK